MRRLLFIAASILLYSSAFAQDYSSSLISKDLLPYASAVVREFNTTVEIKSTDDVIYHVKKAITVLNSNGAEYAHFGVWYNKSIQIRSLKAVIYDEYNKPIKKVSTSDFMDQASMHDFSLFEDYRVKHYNPSVADYPYTVVYEYEIREKQSLNIRPWFPSYSAGEAVEKSTYTVLCKPSDNLRYKETNYNGQVTTGMDEKGYKTYTWQASNIKARREEPFSPFFESYVTNVRVTLQNFSYQGIAGSFTDWNQLGKWTYDKLLNNRQSLPLGTVEYIRQLTAGVKDPKEKARLIYQYMQNKTRYVSIQIGIGGYQPFTATEVDQLSYGDCKGLVNYTQSLLKVAGIDSYYCVVEAGNAKVSMKKDFASMDQGNHIILCLPFKNDTTWLECTNKSIPFGYLGDFTDDRLVLACTPEGGKLLHTPKYTAQDNLETRNADFSITEDGAISGKMNTLFTGTKYEYRQGLAAEPYTDQVKAIKRIYPINNMEVQAFKLDTIKKNMPVAKEQVQLMAREFANTEDGKITFMVNPVDKSGSIREIRNRALPLYINRGFTDEDKITYTLPEGYHPDKSLLDVKVHKNFGDYTASVMVKGNQLVYTRKFELIDGTYSKEAYNDLVDFYQTAEEADHYRMVLIKSK